MKNFFKKLSFVMALAMVLTALAPAVAGADASYIYKRGNDTQKEALEVYFGDADEKRDLNVKINGKKTNDGTWKIGNKAIATIDENGVVTPVKNGTTTAKFTAEDGTAVKVKVVVGTRAAGIKVKDNGEAVTELAMTVGEAKELKFGAYISGKAKKAGATKASQEVTFTVEGEAVTTAQDGKYVTVTAAKAGEATITFTAGKKTATVAVTVVESLAAEQAGAAKIKVTGSDLTANVADYAVKRGTVVVNFKSVTLNEDKTEATLVASASKLTKGAYTLSFQKSEPVEFTVVDAVVSSIEITSDVAVLATGSTTQATANFVVYNQFGENVTRDNLGYLTVSGATKSVDAAGVGVATFTSAQPYTPNLSVVALTVVCNTNGVNASKTLKISTERTLATVEYVGVFSNATGTWKEATLKEGMTTGDLTSYYVVFAAKDQYGNAYTDPTNLNVIVSGVPGATVSGATTTVNYVNIGYQLAATYPLMAGTANAMAIVKTNGNTAQGAIEVAPKTKIASIAVNTSEIYGGQWNTVEYEILDTEGNPVTSYATLKAFDADATDYLPANVRFQRNTDGTAAMQIQAPANVVYDQPLVLSLRSETNVFTTVQLTVRPDRKPAAIGGVAKTAILGALNGNDIVIDVDDVVVLDQYGNAWLSPVTLTAVTADPARTGAFGNATIAGGNITVPTVSTKLGTGELTIGIAGVENSEATVNVVSTDIEKIESFNILDTGLLHSATTGVAIAVTGTVGNTLVLITPDKYAVVDHSTVEDKIDTPVIYNNGVPTTKSMTFTVVIANKAGSVVTKTVEYSDTTPVVTSVKLATGAKITTTSTQYIADLLSKLVIKDQYGEYSDALVAGARAQVSGFATIAGAAANNNTNAVAVSGLGINDVAIHVVFTFANGFVFETDIPVVIQ